MSDKTRDAIRDREERKADEFSAARKAAKKADKKTTDKPA